MKFHKRKNTINAQRSIKYSIQTMAQNAAVGNLVIEEDSKYWAYAQGVYILKMLFTYLYIFKHNYSTFRHNS